MDYTHTTHTLHDLAQFVRELRKLNQNYEMSVSDDYFFAYLTILPFFVFLLLKIDMARHRERTSGPRPLC